MGYLIILIITFNQAISHEYFPGKFFDGMREVENMGEVIALEAPVFSSPDANSKILFYHRKGMKINIHPAEFSQDRYEKVINIDQSEVKKYKEKYHQDYPDELLSKEDTYYPDPDSLFYKTLLHSGREAWIFKEHVFLITNDQREYNKVMPNFDNTDYRIEEPLPENFPFKKKTGYRGSFSVGMGSSRHASYPFKERVNSTGYGLLTEVSALYLKNILPQEYDKKLYFGVKANYHSYSNNYKLQTREASEEHYQFNLGPAIAYDIFENDQYIVNVLTSMQLSLLSSTKITQIDFDQNIKEQRIYQGYGLIPQAQLTFSRKKIIHSFDLILGTNIHLDLSHNLQTNDEVNQSSWWRGSEFNRASSLQTTYFLGLQSNY